MSYIYLTSTDVDNTGSSKILPSIKTVTKGGRLLYTVAHVRHPAAEHGSLNIFR